MAINDGVDLVENDVGGVVALWGMAAFCWETGDVAGRRLGAVNLVSLGAATQAEVAAGFDVNSSTLRSWIAMHRDGGPAGLAPGVKGPQRASKLTETKVAEIRTVRATGASMEKVAAETGVSLNSVSRALRVADPLRPEGGPATPAGETESLVPLARPAKRTSEREAARAGLLEGAAPLITNGASLPLAGALVILPALAVTGLLDTVAKIYDTGRRAAFYGLASLILTVVLSCLAGEPRAEGLTRLDPVALGRLLGLDRAPEVRTLRRRMEHLARARHAEDLVTALAAVHLKAHATAAGIFYIDGHVRAYHGRARLPKAHLARARLAMPGIVDTWVTDARGDGVLVWTGPPGAALTGELRAAMGEIRALVGPDARPTLAFDRGGWSPAGFAEAIEAGFDIATYRKGKADPEPEEAFSVHDHVDDLGHSHAYHLAERPITLEFKDPKSRQDRQLTLRQVTRLDPASGHQTQVLTSATGPSTPDVAQGMFNRWRIENFFRYTRPHYALDALDSYAKIADDPTRTVPNPAKVTARRATATARAGQQGTEAALAAAVAAATDPSAGGPEEATAAIRTATGALDAAVNALTQAKQAARAIPARVALGDLHPDAVLPDPERKRITDAIRMATFNAENATVRLLTPHYARADDEAHSLLREALRASADMEVTGTDLHVRLDPLSAPRRSRAIANLCDELNRTETTYPGTDLRLVYSVKDT